MKTCSIIILIVLSAFTLSAQNTNIQLPTASDTNSSFRVTNNSGTTLLRLNADGGFYFGGVMMTGSIPATGSGNRIMWYPGKSAFRVGAVTGTLWNDIYTGLFSIGMGRDTKAQGESSVAIGEDATANANYSMAIGGNALADNEHALAIGTNATASGNSSTALGVYTTASGDQSTAIGAFTTASGIYSTAVGSHVKANHTGAFIIGDWSKMTDDSTSADNQMKMRFAGGYVLYTNNTCSIGATLKSGENSWGTTSDSTKKTNFEKAEGEYFLRSLSQLRLGSWNYKAQNAKTFRHYGPMAQEIFHYFGKDNYGTIGNETTLASADMDGIMMICLQALEKRTTDLQKANEKIADHENKIKYLEKRIEELSNFISASVSNQNSKPITNK